MAAGAGSENAGIVQLLATPRYDLLPYNDFDTSLSAVPASASVAITLAPELGVWPTVERAEQAAAAGYDAVPHIAPRFIASREEMEIIVDRLTRAGITDIFVPGGDCDEPVGPYASALEFLVDLEEIDHSFTEIGIAGYPEGHEFLDDAIIQEALQRKTPYATYLVTQLCFDATSIVEWIGQVREQDIDLPIEVGIPGVVQYPRLMRMSWEYGVAKPLQFLRKTTGVRGFLMEMLRSKGRFTPDTILADLAPYVDDPAYDIQTLRLYTFNQTLDSERWREAQMKRYRGAE